MVSRTDSGHALKIRAVSRQLVSKPLRYRNIKVPADRLTAPKSQVSANPRSNPRQAALHDHDLAEFVQAHSVTNARFVINSYRPLTKT
jgi:hypothetical protein